MPLKHTTKSEEILSTNGESLLYLKHYSSGIPRHHILIVHGAVEHAGRFNDLVHFLLKNLGNVHITTYDHLGHGRSGGARADFDRMSILIDDMEMIAKKAVEEHPSAHHWIFAHSMGGLIALSSQFATNPYPELRGMVLSNPCIRPVVHYEALLEKTVRGVEKFFPFFHLPTLYRGAHLTRDPVKANEFYTDPLVSKYMTARMAKEIYESSQKLRREAYYIKCKTLFLIGQKDEVVDPESTKLFAGAIDKSLKTVIQYPEHYHDLWNELGRDKIFETIINWMKQEL